MCRDAAHDTERFKPTGTERSPPWWKCPKRPLWGQTNSMKCFKVPQSYLQFGGGSRVISASSFWILQEKEEGFREPTDSGNIIIIIIIATAAVSELLSADTSLSNPKLNNYCSISPHPQNSWQWLHSGVSFFQRTFNSVIRLIGTGNNLFKMFELPQVVSAAQHLHSAQWQTAWCIYLWKLTVSC